MTKDEIRERLYKTQKEIFDGLIRAGHPKQAEEWSERFFADFEEKVEYQYQVEKNRLYKAIDGE